MKPARNLMVALTLSGCLVGLLGSARSSRAQCVPDPPTGSMWSIACGDYAQRVNPAEPASPVLDLGTLFRSPLAGLAAWRPAMFKGVLEAVLPSRSSSAKAQAIWTRPVRKTLP